jgi:hypothetical protein
LFRLAAFYTAILISIFTKQLTLKEVNRTEPFPSVSVPWSNHSKDYLASNLVSSWRYLKYTKNNQNSFELTKSLLEQYLKNENILI